MTNNGAPEVQHYVPQFLLRNFTNTKEQVFVFDKQTQRTFTPNIKNIAAERDFYVLDQNKGKIDFEPFYTAIEDLAAPVFKKIADTENLSLLNEGEREVLSVFIAVQCFRTKQHRESIKKMNETLAKRISAMGFDLKKVKNFKLLGEADIKAISLLFLKDTPKFASLIASKNWMLMSSKKPSFYISDHPIGLHNNRDYGPYGNLGLAVRGIEIYLPVTPKLALAMLCPREMGEAFALQEDNQRLDQHIVALATLGGTEAIRKNAELAIIEGKKKAKEVGLEQSNQMLNNLRAGLPNDSNDEHIEFMRYLQTRFSTRFIFSATDDFDIVRKILKEHPSWVKGITPQVDY